MSVFSGWYTDLCTVYRMTESVVKGITRKERTKKYEDLPCRVYRSAKHGPTYTERDPKLNSDDTAAFAIGTDIIAGDELEITRGGAVGGTGVTRYFAGDVMPCYEPVGGAFNGLSHVEVGLISQEII